VAQRVNRHIAGRDPGAFQRTFEDLPMVVYGFSVFAFVKTKG
jgi:hypothetical protein